MKLWASLYLLIWILVLEFLLVMVVPGVIVLIYLHAILGIAIIAITYYNFTKVKNTSIAGRVKRTAQACFYFSIAMLILGVLLAFNLGGATIIPPLIFTIVLFFHVFFALAMITQSAAIAIAYDMWEENEFKEQTQPGSVPPAPKPTKQ